ncbi:NAD(P)/FAD-dependent oxidoreductase [Algihabitans albus]|uniref:NAD(P)/FAD-dependent oxidoreductase n=1 Tax=Algihabitans albus TaxID=2164067 RepID=UPI000E5D8E63|nr:FAD-binding oxidoreductase [Algihabitans albus]
MIYDYAVLGAGMAGAAVAFELAASGTVVLIEAEAQPGYHSTGRSAALFTPNYGNETVRGINRISQPFFKRPPAGFTDHPLLSRRGALTVAGPGEEAALEAVLAFSSSSQPVERVTPAEACRMAPLLRPDLVAAAVFEPGVTDIDVAALHQGYLRGFKARGGTLVCHARARALSWQNGYWRVTAGSSVTSGAVLVNAAGAWADEIGSLAGATPIGLVPKRRTAIVVDAPPGMDVRDMPAVDAAGSQAYLKPEAGRIMASLGDETPVTPQDVQPEELDVALIADWLERCTLVKLNRIEHSWAGLRSFVTDGVPAIGFDAGLPSFFWLAGLGGYGIMMSPALGRAAATLMLTGRLPQDFGESGLTEATLSPARFGGIAVPSV